jgi:hypothetical protein
MLERFEYGCWKDMEAAGWTLRGTEYGTTGSRTNTKAHARAVSVADGVLTLKVRRDHDNPGKHLVGHIATPPIPHPFLTIRARIQFGRPKGAHGALWHQSGYGEGQAELDVVEWFGERNAPSGTTESQRVQHTVHTGPLDADGKTHQHARFTWTGADTDVMDVPSYEGRGQFGLDRTWWHTSHLYECEWTPDGYTFRVDDVTVGHTTLPAANYSSPAATEPGQLILSLLSNDGPERDDLLAHIDAGGRYSDYDMHVTRLEVWR